MHRLNILRQREIDERLAADVLALGDIFVAVDIGKFPGAHGYVLAVVAVLGQLGRVGAFVYLLIADIEREGEFIDLIAGVVDIEFAADIVARKVHDRREAVTQSAAAGVAHVHRSCRIGGDEFDIYLFALAEVGATVVAALLADIHKNLRIEAVGETEVYESGTRRLAG